MVNGFSRRATSDECECMEEACLAKIGSGFEINNIQRAVSHVTYMTFSCCGALAKHRNLASI
jgi:hypothetical protein